jgi:hypothetical protein
MGADAVIPPLPDGFKLDEVPPLPQGFQLDQPSQPKTGALDYLRAAGHLAIPGGAALKAFSTLDKSAYDIGGRVTDVTGSPGLGFAANVGVQALPVIAGAGVGSKLVPQMEKKAFDLMASAAKPNLSQWESGEAKRAIDTLLKEGISPTEGGVEVLKSKIAALNEKIKQAVSSSTETVKIGDTGKPLLDTLNNFTKQVNAQDDLASIRKVWGMYRNHPALAGQQDMPVQLAQQLKQGTYRQLEGKYGELTSAETEAQKAIARGLKDEIAAKIPALKDLNAKESELLNALTIAERRALLDLNSNPGGLVWLYHHPTAAAGYLAARSAPFKAMVARMLHNTPEALPTASGALTGGAADILNQAR